MKVEKLRSFHTCFCLRAALCKCRWLLPSYLRFRSNLAAFSQHRASANNPCGLIPALQRVSSQGSAQHPRNMCKGIQLYRRNISLPGFIEFIFILVLLNLSQLLERQVGLRNMLFNIQVLKSLLVMEATSQKPHGSDPHLVNTYLSILAPLSQST